MISAALIITLAASLAACGEKEQQAEKKGDTKSSSVYQRAGMWNRR